MSEWQPIKTAPRSGDIQVYCSDSGEQMVAFWHSDDDGTFQFAHFHGVPVVCKPTHWMPLPEPPK